MTKNSGTIARWLHLADLALLKDKRTDRSLRERRKNLQEHKELIEQRTKELIQRRVSQ